ncbi:hypothetical protein QAD02_020489 [Eretmocerus hayati]|uniref:Uncharacterized protein n=1 Tax=Eretmocerus hayati TaxID=131215 RepID=A0ACC2PMK3_9HYME|nr:hypothetical protein QAD02_020489 [Eretmocerus hayati]
MAIDETMDFGGQRLMDARGSHKEGAMGVFARIAELERSLDDANAELERLKQRRAEQKGQSLVTQLVLANQNLESRLAQNDRQGIIEAVSFISKVFQENAYVFEELASSKRRVAGDDGSSFAMECFYDKKGISCEGKLLSLDDLSELQRNQLGDLDESFYSRLKHLEKQRALEELHERKFCNPFNKHSKEIKTNLFKIPQGIHNTHKHGISLILEVMPKISWTASEIVERIGVTRYLAEKSIKIAAENGILYKPSVKSGKKIHPSSITLIGNFYESDDVSRVMLGKNDCESYKVDDVKEKHQKRLLLGDLREIYHRFKECDPNVEVGFSRFAMERTRHCIIAGGAGTHSVCVCKMHQNMKLLLDALILRRTDPKNYWNYQYVLS